jgi:hypothetical protein
MCAMFLSIEKWNIKWAISTSTTGVSGAAQLSVGSSVLATAAPRDDRDESSTRRAANCSKTDLRITPIRGNGNAPAQAHEQSDLDVGLARRFATTHYRIEPNGP